jgi:hypothetical protein
MSDSDDLSRLGDPEFLAERRRVREAIAHAPSPELTARYERINDEFDRRARNTWASASQG